MPSPRRVVYILRNDAQPPRYYTGVTSDLASRLLAHNDGQCRHTANGCPWHVDVVIEFPDERRAVAFERYLKSGSGCALYQAIAFSQLRIAASSCPCARSSAAASLNTSAGV